MGVPNSHTDVPKRLAPIAAYLFIHYIYLFIYFNLFISTQRLAPIVAYEPFRESPSVCVCVCLCVCVCVCVCVCGYMDIREKRVRMMRIAKQKHIPSLVKRGGVAWGP